MLFEIVFDLTTVVIDFGRKIDQGMPRKIERKLNQMMVAVAALRKIQIVAIDHHFEA